MGSSGGGGDGGLSSLLMMQQGTPMPGLPIAGSSSATGDPYEYGKFQNFLPDAKAEGPNDMATGLRPDMFEYRKPNPGGGTMRDVLAQAVAGGTAGGAAAGGDAGAVGTMGLGSGIQGPQGPAGSNPAAMSNGPVVYPIPGWRDPQYGNIQGPQSPGANPTTNQFATDWRTKDAAAKAGG